MLELKSNKDTSNVIFTLFIAHLFIIAISNYLVQYTFNIYGIDITWGTLTFPLIFLATDLTVRIVGKDKARKVVLLAMFPALIVSYVISVLFVSGKFTSFSELLSFNTFVFRIAIASFIAYVVGQLLDIKIFTKLRKFKFWWLAPISSTLFSSIVDTFLFFFIAFYASSDEFMAANWLSLFWVDYFFKIIVSLILFIPLYGVIVKLLQNKLQTQTA